MKTFNKEYNMYSKYKKFIYNTISKEINTNIYQTVSNGIYRAIEKDICIHTANIFVINIINYVYIDINTRMLNTIKYYINHGISAKRAIYKAKFVVYVYYKDVAKKIMYYYDDFIKTDNIDYDAIKYVSSVIVRNIIDCSADLLHFSFEYFDKQHIKNDNNWIVEYVFCTINTNITSSLAKIKKEITYGKGDKN